MYQLLEEVRGCVEQASSLCGRGKDPSGKDLVIDHNDSAASQIVPNDAARRGDGLVHL